MATAKDKALKKQRKNYLWRNPKHIEQNEEVAKYEKRTGNIYKQRD